MKKYIVISIFLFLISAVLILGWWYSKPAPLVFRCPESTTSPADWGAALETDVQIEINEIPKMTAREYLEKRYELLVANHCTQTLQNLQAVPHQGSTATEADIVNYEMRDSNATSTQQ
jgi:hypothetical protein